MELVYGQRCNSPKPENLTPENNRNPERLPDHRTLKPQTHNVAASKMALLFDLWNRLGNPCRFPWTLKETATAIPNPLLTQLSNPKP